MCNRGYLSTEVGGLFTGVFFALYATGNGSKAESAPQFADFHITPWKKDAP
ncbi:MAG: hypothetical protein ACLFU4_10095 [Opitutales bacterium]